MTDARTVPAPGNGPWRILLLDRDPRDPKWVVASVTLPTDARAAVLDSAGRYQDWDEVTEWVRAQVGARVALVPVHDALAWRIGGQPR